MSSEPRRFWNLQPKSRAPNRADHFNQSVQNVSLLSAASKGSLEPQSHLPNIAAHPDERRPDHRAAKIAFLPTPTSTTDRNRDYHCMLPWPAAALIL